MVIIMNIVNNNYISVYEFACLLFKFLERTMCFLGTDDVSICCYGKSEIGTRDNLSVVRKKKNLAFSIV